MSISLPDILSVVLYILGIILIVAVFERRRKLADGLPVAITASLVARIVIVIWIYSMLFGLALTVLRGS